MIAIRRYVLMLVVAIASQASLFAMFAPQQHAHCTPMLEMSRALSAYITLVITRETVCPSRGSVAYVASNIPVGYPPHVVPVQRAAAASQRPQARKRFGQVREIGQERIDAVDSLTEEELAEQEALADAQCEQQALNLSMRSHYDLVTRQLKRALRHAPSYTEKKAIFTRCFQVAHRTGRMLLTAENMTKRSLRKLISLYRDIMRLQRSDDIHTLPSYARAIEKYVLVVLSYMQGTFIDLQPTAVRAFYASKVERRGNYDASADMRAQLADYDAGEDGTNDFYLDDEECAEYSTDVAADDFCEACLLSFPDEEAVEEDEEFEEDEEDEEEAASERDVSDRATAVAESDDEDELGINALFDAKNDRDKTRERNEAMKRRTDKK